MRAGGDLLPVLDDEIRIHMPAYDAIVQAFFSYLHRLTCLKVYDENSFKIPDSETTEGEMAFITIVTPDTKMLPHLMYYIYHRRCTSCSSVVNM